MSAKALKWAFDQHGIRSSAKFVLVVMASVTNECALFYGSAEFLAEETNLNRKTVFDAIKYLEEAGLITDTGARAGKSGRLRTFRLEMATKHSTEIGTVKKGQNQGVGEAVLPPSDTVPVLGRLNEPKNGTVKPVDGISGQPPSVPPDLDPNHSTEIGTVAEADPVTHSTENGTGTVTLTDNHSTEIGYHIKIKTEENISTTNKTDGHTLAQALDEKIPEPPPETDPKTTPDDTVCTIGDAHQILTAGGIPFSWLNRTDCMTAIRDMVATGVTHGELREAVQRAHAAKGSEPFGVFYVRPIVGEIIARRNGYAKTGGTPGATHGANALDAWIAEDPSAAQG